MERTVSFLRRPFCMILLAGMMFVLSACSSVDASKQNNEYYEQLSEYTDTLLMQNRELTEISKAWSYKDKASTDKYINQLSEIEKTVTKIKNINASEEFIEFDEEYVENNCDILFESIALSKTMIRSAYDTGDDSDYKQVDEENSNKYNDSYEAIISSVANLRTRIR